MNKILVINGRFYAGPGKGTAGRRSEAKEITRQEDLVTLLDILVTTVREGKIDLRRIEILDARGEEQS